MLAEAADKVGIFPLPLSLSGPELAIYANGFSCMKDDDAAESEV